MTTIVDHDNGDFSLLVVAPSAALEGSPVELTYLVSYSSEDNSDGYVKSIEDSQCAPLTYVSGDVDGDGWVGAGEMWVYTCTAVMPAADVVHEVLLTGNDADLAAVRSTSASAEIVLSESEMRVAFLGEHSAPHHNEISFTYSVTFISLLANVAAESVTVSTTEVCTSSQPIYSSGDTNGDGKLQSSETWIYSCVHTIGEHVDFATEPIRQVVTATGYAPRSEELPAEELSAQTVGSTLVTHATGTLAIDVVGTAHAARGTATSYAYFVSYSSSDGSPLTSVEVSDSECSRLNYVRGDIDNDGVLDTGELWEYECSVVMPDSPSVQHLATAAGVTLGGETISAEDSLLTSQSEGSLQVSFAGPNEASHAQVTTFQFLVTYSNPGDSTAASQVATITANQCDSALQYVSGDVDGDAMVDTDETWLFECTRTLTPTHSEHCDL